MPWLIIALTAIAAGVVKLARGPADRSAPPPAYSSRVKPPDHDQLWREAEREIIAYRMRSNPGPL